MPLSKPLPWQPLKPLSCRQLRPSRSRDRHLPSMGTRHPPRRDVASPPTRAVACLPWVLRGSLPGIRSSKRERRVYFGLNSALGRVSLPRVSSSSPKLTPSLVRVRDGDRAVEALEDELVDHFAELAAMLALPRSYGQIYGLLFASPQPLSFTDIVERLDLSKGSVSQGLHALREVGAIHPAEGSDWRREHFVAEAELRPLIGGFLRGTIQPQLKQGLDRVERLRSRYRAQLVSHDGDGKALLDRLERLRGWHRKGGTVLPIISRVLG